MRKLRRVDRACQLPAVTDVDDQEKRREPSFKVILIGNVIGKERPQGRGADFVSAGSSNRSDLPYAFCAALGSTLVVCVHPEATVLSLQLY